MLNKTYGDEDFTTIRIRIVISQEVENFQQVVNDHAVKLINQRLAEVGAVADGPDVSLDLIKLDEDGMAHFDAEVTFLALEV